jgi:general secretion pathway protein M
MKTFDDARARAQAFWLGRAPGERRQLAIGGAVAGLLILIFGILWPLQDARQRLANTVARERQRTASMAAVQKEIERLGAIPHAAPATGEALRSAIEASARTTFAPAAVAVTLEGGGIKLRGGGIAFERLAPWIDATRRGQRLRLQGALLRPEAGNTVMVELEFVGAAQ